MLRSQILQLIKLLQRNSSPSQAAELDLVGIGRSCRLGHVTCLRQFSLSGAVRKDETKDPKSSNNPSTETKESEVIPIDDKIRVAATDAAKSLPGDWSKTAETLLARLSAHKVAAESVDNSAVTSEKPKSSLLQSMKVQKAFSEERRDQDSRQRNVQDRFDRFDRKGEGRRQQYRDGGPRFAPIKDLFEVRRLGIFNAEKVKSQIGKAQPVMGKGLWEEYDANMLRHALGGIPQNAYEEQIELTKQGKLWQFPIDNEADMHEERRWKFHDHVFLERHLGNDFPASGPIRKFMSLVCLGLSQSPHLTVPEKVEHIRWFVGYFREKQSIIEAAIPGEEGKMPNTGDQRQVE